MENLSREQYAYLAKVAEQAERYDEMAEFMRSLVLSAAPSSDLTAEERGLLSTSLKQVVGSLRASWRIVSSIERRRNVGEEEAEMTRSFKAGVETEIESACRAALGLLESHLLPSAAATDSKIFFLKMKGDYFRYIAEIQTGEERASSSAVALASYSAAQELAEAELPARHPQRLGVALNFSVFYYEILEQHDKACRLAKEAFEDAMGEAEPTVAETLYKESIMILQLLRDNLNVWTVDQEHRLTES